MSPSTSHPIPRHSPYPPPPRRRRRTRALGLRVHIRSRLRGRARVVWRLERLHGRAGGHGRRVAGARAAVGAEEVG